MLRNLLGSKYILTGVVLLSSLHLLSSQATGNDAVIELRLVPNGDNVYKLFVSNVPCFDAKFSTIKAEDLKQSGWTRTKMPVKEGATYDLLEIKPIKNWVLDKDIHYDDLINPCNKEKIGFLRFAVEGQELILPIIAEKCYAYAIDYSEKGATTKLVTRGDTILPLWCFGKTSSAYYVLTIEGTPKSRLSVRPELLGDINPRPIWEMIF